MVIKGDELLKGSFYNEELEFLKGSESKPVPLFKNEKTSLSFLAVYNPNVEVFLANGSFSGSFAG